MAAAKVGTTEQGLLMHAFPEEEKIETKLQTRIKKEITSEAGKLKYKSWKTKLETLFATPRKKNTK